MEDIILVGYGGHGKSVADSIDRTGKFRIVGYTDKVCAENVTYEYLGNDDVLLDYYERGVHNAFVCVGYLGKGTVRQDIYRKLKKIGYEIPVIVDPSASVSASVQIGEGTFVGKGCIVNAEAQVGKMCILNTKCLVEHECSVGNFAHVAVGAVLCGQVEVGTAAFVGAGAVVIQCRKVHDNQIIPAGEVVR